MVDGVVGFRVGALYIGTHTDEVPGLLIAGVNLLEALGTGKVSRVSYLWHYPADGGFHVNGGVMTLFRQATG